MTPVYDWVLRVLMRESVYKSRLVEYLSIIKQPLKILDAGCGTATLTIMMKQRLADADITGIDGDRKILQIAQEKARNVGLKINLDYGFITQLPYESQSFDCGVCSLVLHHLTTENKQKALQELFRVIKPNGRLLILDFSTPHNFPMMMVTLAAQYFEETYDNFRGRLLEFITKTGFVNLQVELNSWTPIGTISLLTAQKPTTEKENTR
ncbi:MAG: class I SAM-dependent methyltransferase [Bacteroidota bacterium]